MAEQQFVIWDPTKRYLDRPDSSNVWNRSCPPGYFAQFVGPDQADAAQYAPGKFIRCRLAATSTDGTIWEEGGQVAGEGAFSWRDLVGQSLQNFRDSIVGPVSGTADLIKWAVIGLVAYAIIVAWPRGSRKGD